MNKDFYISLIARKLSNELSASQLKDLSSWLVSNKDNAVLMDDFKTVWQSTGQYAQAPAINVDSAFENFSGRFNIPKAEPRSMQAVRRKKFLQSFAIPIIIVLILSLGALLFFSGILNKGTVVNENMSAMTVQLDAFSELTLAPNSAFKKGEGTMIDKSRMPEYENLFTIVENRKGESRPGNSEFYTPLSTLFEPQNKNYIIEDFRGQGYFELKSINEHQAFLGLGNGWSVGTRDASFNIQNYEDEDIIIDIQKGTLVFYDGRNNAYIISKGERALFQKESMRLKALKQPANNPFKWHKGILIFNDTPLDEVFNRIEKFYGVDITIVDDSKLNKNFTATLSMSNNLNDCLALLQNSIDMTIRRKGLRDIEVSDIAD